MIYDWPNWAEKLRALDTLRSAQVHLRKTRPHWRTERGEMKAALDARQILLDMVQALLCEAYQVEVRA